MADATSQIPITESDLLPYAKSAEAHLASVEWAPKRDVRTDLGNKSVLGPMIAMSPSTGGAVSTKLSLWKIAQESCGDALIISEPVHHVLGVLKKAIQIGLHLETLYAKASGLDELERLNKARTLPTTQEPEFNAKQVTRAAIAIYATAAYVVWELGGYMTEEVSGTEVEQPAIAELPLSNSVLSRRSSLFYLGSGLATKVPIDNSLAFVKFTMLYFRALIAEVKLREGQLQHKEPFADRTYKLEESEFILHGFEEMSDRTIVSVEFDRVSFKQIVGNERAIHATERAFDRLFSYDFATKRNPFAELRGLAKIRAGYGRPGTGKTLLGKAGATRGDERAKWLGVPFMYHEFPGNMVSSLQGQSAERMDNWMRAFRDPTKIIYGVVDDAETNFEDRKRQGASEGSRLIVGSFLRNTEGVSVIDRGNWMLDFLTNLIEQMDPAALSRVVERFPIDGAQTAEQYAAQNWLWWKMYQEMNPGLIDIATPSGYDYLAAQKASGEQAAGYREAKNERIKAIVEQTLAKYDLHHHLFFGTLFRTVQIEFPGFTSRDDRNIQSAVSSRMLDFDFPQDWRDDPVIFYRRDYDTKKGMLSELMQANMKGLSFSQIFLEESLFYLDNFVNITNVEFEDQVRRVMESMRVNEEAARRVTLSAKK